MTTALMRGRIGAGLACLALTGGLAACGGGNDDGTKKDYQAAINTFCKTVETGANKVQTDVTAAQGAAASDPTKIFAKIGGALDSFATSVDGGLSRFKKADVPGEYKDFNNQAVSGISSLVSKLRDAAKAATAGDAAALTKFSQTLGNVKFPKLPADLAKGAPSCGRISS